jgi:hypothetical protein
MNSFLFNFDLFFVEKKIPNVSQISVDQCDV